MFLGVVPGASTVGRAALSDIRQRRSDIRATHHQHVCFVGTRPSLLFYGTYFS